MFYDWFIEEYNPQDSERPVNPTRQVRRRRRKSRFEVLFQFLITAGFLVVVFGNLFLELTVDTSLKFTGVGLLYFLFSFFLYPVDHHDQENLPDWLLSHPYRLPKTERGYLRVFTLLMAPGWVISGALVRFVTLLRYVTVRGEQADQWYYTNYISLDLRWLLPWLGLFGLSFTTYGEDLEPMAIVIGTFFLGLIIDGMRMAS